MRFTPASSRPSDLTSLIGQHILAVDWRGLFPSATSDGETIAYETYLSFPGEGFEVATDFEQLVDALFFHSSLSAQEQDAEDFAQFSGSLPADITFEMNRPEIQRLLGPPVASGGGVTSPILGLSSNWDRWPLPNELWLRCEYRPEESSLFLVSVTAREPGGEFVIERETALRIAEEHLRYVLQPPMTAHYGIELSVSGIDEFPTDWVIGWDSRQFVETGAVSHALVGHGPMIVSKRDGVVRLALPGIPIEDQVDQVDQVKGPSTDKTAPDQGCNEPSENL